MTWKTVERFFYGAAAVATIILIFGALFAIWEVVELDEYWRMLAGLSVLVFTGLVCGVTAHTLEKTMDEYTNQLASGSGDVTGSNHTVLMRMRNWAGGVLILIFLGHGLLGFAAVLNSHDDIFGKLLLSVLTFVIGYFVLSLIIDAIQFGYKKTLNRSNNNSGVIILIVVLLVLAAIFW